MSVSSVMPHAGYGAHNKDTVPYSVLGRAGMAYLRDSGEALPKKVLKRVVSVT